MVLSRHYPQEGFHTLIYQVIVFAAIEYIPVSSDHRDKKGR
jgi:hypothetical protein